MADFIADLEAARREERKMGKLRALLAERAHAAGTRMVEAEVAARRLRAQVRRGPARQLGCARMGGVVGGWGWGR